MENRFINFKNLCRQTYCKFAGKPYRKSIIFILYAIFLFSIHKWYAGVDWFNNTKLIESDIGYVSSIVFGITSGVICLLGLVAIFVSLNSQHKLQKCRELYWEILNLSNKRGDILDLSTQMTYLLWQYTKISIFDDDDFVKTIIKGSQRTILFVVIVWASFIPFLHYSLIGKVITWISFIGGVEVLFFFYSILGRLGNLIDIGKLKEPRDILDIVKNKEIGGLIFLASNIELQALRTGRNTYSISFNLTTPFYGFLVTVMGVGYITWKEAHTAVDNNIYIHPNLLKMRSGNNSYILGFSEVTKVNLEIIDKDAKIKDWMKKGTYWNINSDEVLGIRRIDDRLGANDNKMQEGYEAFTCENGREIIVANVPSDTYAVRIYTSIKRKESSNKSEELKIVWEIPIDTNGTRKVFVSLESNGQQMKNQYWNIDNIKGDFTNFEQIQREKDNKWSRD